MFFDLIKKEEKRQKNTINLIASENYVSQNVLRALGSVFTNKYSEGYVGARYYAGNKLIDELEELVKREALKAFKLSSDVWSVNVQPYSGSIANLATYSALLERDDKIMAMDLSAGGHLTHGSKVSITGKFWEQIPYGVNKETGLIDYGEVAKIAKDEKPKLIIAGGSAYSRIIDFKKFREIADFVDAILMIDMAHFAGLVVGDVYPSPFEYADIVTTTTHKTLRGPRGAMIFSKKEYSSKIDKAVFPGVQGGPHMNNIAAVGIALEECQTPEFCEYTNQVIKNAKVLSEEIQKNGWRIVSDGTDTHLFLVDLGARGLSGEIASDMLESVGIIVNKNMIPFDSRKAMDPSGIRIGTPAITTRGMKEDEMKLIAELIDSVLLNKKDAQEIQKEVQKLTEKF